MPTTYEMLTLPADGDPATAGSVNDLALRTIALWLRRYTELQAVTDLSLRLSAGTSAANVFNDVVWAPGTDSGASNANDDGRFVAVGWDLAGGAEGRYAHSYDGDDWTVAIIAVDFYPRGVGFQRNFAAPLGNKKVVAVGNDASGGGRVYYVQATSLPAAWTSWTPSPQPTLQLNHAVYAHPNWLLLGHYSATNNGQILSTADLSTYVSRTPGGGGTNNYYRGHLHASGSKVTVVGTNNQIQESADAGATWTQRAPSGSPSSYTLTHIIEPVAGTLLAGGDGTGQSLEIFRSVDDGATWAALATLPAGTGAYPEGVRGLYSVGKAVIAVVFDGLTYKALVSFDYGSTWVASVRWPGSSPSIAAVPAGAAVSPSRLVVVGANDANRGLVWATPRIAEWI